MYRYNGTLIYILVSWFGRVSDCITIGTNNKPRPNSYTFRLVVGKVSWVCYIFTRLTVAIFFFLIVLLACISLIEKRIISNAKIWRVLATLSNL